MQYYRSFLLVICIASILLFIRLGAVTVFQNAEARNSHVAAEMLQRDDYVVPYFNGNLRTDKPPLHYYAMLLCYSLGGVNETGARFFSSLCGLLMIAATWLFAKRNASPGVAWWSCAALLASTNLIFQFRVANPDPYLIACHVLSLYCFWEGFVNRQKIFILVMYFLFGLGILAKGPVGVALPAATVFCYLLFTRQLSSESLRRLRVITGAMITLLVALPWFYLVHVRTDGEWTRGFFLFHNYDRVFIPIDGHRGPFYQVIAFVVVGFFPFAVFLPRAIYHAWKIRKQNDWLLFNLLAAVIIIIPYSLIATKLLNYIIPSYPFLAILIGYLIHQHIKDNPSGNRLWPEWIILLLIALAAPLAVCYWLQSDESFVQMASIGYGLAILSVGTIAAVYFYYKRKISQAFHWFTAAMLICNALFFGVMLPAMDQAGSVSKLKNFLKTDRPVISYRKYNEAFTFYRGKPIPVTQSAEEVSAFLEKNPDALILERDGKPHLQDSVPGLRILGREKDLFSRQYSFIYELNSPH